MIQLETCFSYYSGVATYTKVLTSCLLVTSFSWLHLHMNVNLRQKTQNTGLCINMKMKLLLVMQIKANYQSANVTVVYCRKRFSQLSQLTNLSVSRKNTAPNRLSRFMHLYY